MRFHISCFIKGQYSCWPTCIWKSVEIFYWVFIRIQPPYILKPVRMVTHWGQDNDGWCFVDIFNAFSWNKIVVFWLKFEFIPECSIDNKSALVRYMLVSYSLTLTRRQAIASNNVDNIHHSALLCYLDEAEWTPFDNHYNDVIMSTIASQITRLTTVY